jgi:hypothetical protein
MRLFARRTLTPGEAALARGIFADSLDYGRVRLMQIPPLGFQAMVPHGETILFSRWRAALDFSEAELDEQGWLIHELAHVWQARQGIALAAAKMSALGRGAYLPPAATPFASMNIEAQAEIARFLFLARAGAPVKLRLAELEALWPLRPLSGRAQTGRPPGKRPDSRI